MVHFQFDPEGKIDFSAGIKEIAGELPVLEKCADFSVLVAESETPGFSLKIKNGGAQLAVQEKTDFFRALPFLAAHLGEPDYQKQETPVFEKTGVMLDCSRNAVPSTESLRFLLRKLALMGLNFAMLYTEDTYEVKIRPYFGYLRGRYTQEELRALDDYADALGIELIPCIQTLAHLERALQWPAMDSLRDSERSLMVGEDATYRFIEEMIVAASAPFRSRRIHIGMDEAWELGLGRYLNKNGYHPAGELMAEHLKHVAGILDRHGLHAMMWSDMHFLSASPTHDLYDPNSVLSPEVLNGAPERIDLVYWDYYNESAEHYDALLTLHQKFAAKTVFAGGIWTWIGPAVDYRKTLAATLPALAQCKKHGIGEVIATAWGDDGGEAPALSALLGFQIFAEYRYTGACEERQLLSRFRECCGADGQPFLGLSKFNEIPGLKRTEFGTVTPAKALLFEDPLIPLFEEDFRGLPCEEHYRGLAEQYAAWADETPAYRGLFAFYAGFAQAVAEKCAWRGRAAACVRNGRRGEVPDLLRQADRCIAAVRALKDAWAGLWYSQNKPFGFEVIDLRLGGLISRFETAKERFSRFASGEISTIPELAEPKLPCLRDETGAFRCLNSWGSLATVCRIVG